MSLQEPQEEFESQPVESTEELTTTDSALVESEPQAQVNEPESVDVPAEETPASIDDSSETTQEVEPAPHSPGKTAPASDAPSHLGEVEGPAWYVIHCYSGYENKVRHNLEQRIETMGMKDRIFDVVIPTQEEIEVKDGKRRSVERHIFPGYVLVNLLLTEESWYVVRNTPGVTGFVGMGNNPTPLRPEEVAQIIKRM